MAKTKDQLSQMFAAAAQPQTFAAAVQVVSDQFAQALGGAPQLEAALREQAQRVSDLADLVHTIYAADSEGDGDGEHSHAHTHAGMKPHSHVHANTDEHDHADHSHGDGEKPVKMEGSGPPPAAPATP